MGPVAAGPAIPCPPRVSYPSGGAIFITLECDPARPEPREPSQAPPARESLPRRRSSVPPPPLADPKEEDQSEEVEVEEESEEEERSPAPLEAIQLNM